MKRFEAPLALAEWPPDAPRSSLATRMALTAGGLDEARQWLFADPVHLSIEGQGVVLQGEYTLDLTREEAEVFCQVLTEQFSPEGLRFHALSAGRWLVGASQPLVVETTPLLSRVGQSIDDDLPRGAGRDVWLARFNLAQMVLYDHPLNLKRQEVGKLPVTGIWFWDEEAAPHSDELWMALREPAVYGDPVAWCTAVERFEREIWAPALVDWRTGKLETLTLVALEGGCSAQLTLTSAHRWYFWRRTRRLMDAAGCLP